MTLPFVPETFRWSEEPWGAALRCRPLELVAPHIFTTRQLELSSEDAVRLVGEATGSLRVEMLTQVHSREVAVVRSGAAAPADRPTADAYVSNDPTVTIVVRSADCVPLLIGDRATGAVAAVHAGWRGTAARVAVAAVAALGREFGSRPSDLVVAVGPAIGSCCYEVGSELVDAFAAEGHDRTSIDRWFLAPPARRGSRVRPKLRLDLLAANRDQLALAGVAQDDIHVAGLCTAMHLEVLTSYRAEREQAGRLAAAIRASG